MPATRCIFLGVTKPRDPNPITRTYVSDGDANGVLYFEGQNFSTTGTWTNPHTAGRCTVIASSNVLSGPISDLVNRAAESTYASSNSSGQWLVVDLGAGRSLVVSKYWLKQRADTSNQAMRNWKLQGSNDVATNDSTGVNAATWVDLDTRTADITMSDSVNGSTGIYTVGGTPAAYRHFRIISTGVNSSGSDFNMQLCEIEFYGSLAY